MADEGDILTDLNNDAAGANGADNQPAAGILTQYVKDLSVENPNAPVVYQWQDQPKIDVQFNIAAEPVNEQAHEVTLKITVTSSTDQGQAFLIDLAYCGLAAVRNLGDDQTHAFLFAEAPRILFPFARRVIADAVRDAGFAPLMIDPIDFNGLYLQQLARKQQEEAAAGGAQPPAGDA